MKISVFALFLFVVGCGVKGDPLPPEKPSDLGRGRPTYRRATEDINVERKARVNDEDEEEEDEDEEE